MKKMKHIVSLLLTAVMLCSLMAGCGNKETEESKTSESSVQQSSQDVSTQTSEEPEEYVPTEELALTIWNAQGTDFAMQNKLDDNVVAKWLYDKTLVTVENMYGNDGGQWDVKLSRLIAGDNMPDMLYVGGGQGATHFTTLKDADQIWGISEEMVKQYAPDYYERAKGILSSFEFEDGMYYGFPVNLKIDEETCSFYSQEDLDFINTYMKGVTVQDYKTLWIRDDILKAIYPDAKSWAEIEAAHDGTAMADSLYDIPVYSTEEFVDLMYKIKDVGAESLNGKTVYAYGYSGGDNWEAFTYVGGAMMGYAPHNYTGNWNPNTQEIELLLVQDILKEGAKIQNKLVRDQVFDPESLIQTMDMFKEKGLNGQYAIIAASYLGGSSAVNAEMEKQGADFRYRPFYVQVPTVDGYQQTKSGRAFDASFCLMKTLTEEEVIQVLNWMNVQASEEWEEVYHWGPESAGYYVENADGTRSFTEKHMNERFLNNDQTNADDRSTHGIGISSLNLGEYYFLIPSYEYSKYTPQVYNKVAAMPLYTAVTKFNADSPYLVTEAGPADDIWNAIYANIQECTDFWAERETWENAFKLALAAEDDEMFEKRWQEALDVVAGIVDVDLMLEKMTEVARETLAATLAGK